MGKFLNELNDIVNAVTNPTHDHFGRLFNVLCKLAFGVYWLLDNLQILAEYGYVRMAAFEIEYYSMTAKFIALVLALMLDFRNMVRTHHEEIKTRRTLTVLRQQENLRANEKVLKLVEEQQRSVLMYVKIVGDMMPAIARSLFARRLIKRKVPRTLQSIGGLASALASCYLAL